jgi:hypothetical protein
MDQMSLPPPPTRIRLSWTKPKRPCANESRGRSLNTYDGDSHDS